MDCLISDCFICNCCRAVIGKFLILKKSRPARALPPALRERSGFVIHA